jgi:hypothetical protein
MEIIEWVAVRLAAILGRKKMKNTLKKLIIAGAMVLGITAPSFADNATTTSTIENTTASTVVAQEVIVEETVVEEEVEVISLELTKEDWKAYVSENGWTNVQLVSRENDAMVIEAFKCGNKVAVVYLKELVNVPTIQPEEVEIVEDIPTILPDEVEIVEDTPTVLPDEVEIVEDIPTILPDDFEIIEVVEDVPTILPDEVEVVEDIPTILPDEFEVIEVVEDVPTILPDEVEVVEAAPTTPEVNEPSNEVVVAPLQPEVEEVSEVEEAPIVEETVATEPSVEETAPTTEGFISPMPGDDEEMTTVSVEKTIADDIFINPLTGDVDDLYINAGLSIASCSVLLGLLVRHEKKKEE